MVFDVRMFDVDGRYDGSRKCFSDWWCTVDFPLFLACVKSQHSRSLKVESPRRTLKSENQRFLRGSSSRGGQYCLLMQLLRTYVYFFFLEHKSQFPVVEGSAAPTTDTPPSYKLCTKSTSDSSVRTFKSPLRTKKNHQINQSARSRRVESQKAILEHSWKTQK